MVAAGELRAAIAAASAASGPPRWFGASPILKTALKLRGDIAAAFHAAGAITFPHRDAFAPPFHDLFGSLDGHGLGQRPLYAGFEPSEPQYVAALLHFLSPETGGPNAVARARAFITALMQAAGVPSEEWLDAVATVDGRLMAQVEAPAEVLGKKRRIDLLLRWPLPGRTAWIVVEVKFKHVVTEGQLPAYEESIDTRRGCNDPCWLFVLTVGKDRRGYQHERWHPASWFGVLRRWENLLVSADGDADFARFRSSLWAKLL